MGVGRFVLLEPNVVKLFLELPPPSLEDHRSHLRRVMDAIEEAGYTRNHDWEVLPRIAEAFRNGSTVTATLVGEYLVDCEEGDTRERMFGVSFDIGTTTCVCTLVDLRNGATAAVASTINHQASLRRRCDRADGQGDARTGEHRTAQGRRARHGERAPRPGPGRGRRQARGDLRGGRGRQRHDDVAPAGRESGVDRARPVRRDVHRGAGHPGRPARVLDAPAGLGRDLPVDRCLRRGRHRRGHRRDRARARPRDAPARRRRHERRDRLWQRRAFGGDRGAGGPGVRRRRDPLRDARHRGGDRRRRADERRDRAPGDRRRRRAHGHLRLGTDRHRRAVATRRTDR